MARHHGGTRLSRESPHLSSVLGRTQAASRFRATGDGDPEVFQAGDDPQRHLVVEGERGGRAAGHDLVHDGCCGLERWFVDSDLDHLHPGRPACAPDRGPAFPRRPRSARTAQVGEPFVPERRQMAQGGGDGRCGSKQDGRVPADGAVDEDRRRGSEGTECPVQAARRDDDEAVDVLRQGGDGSHLLIRMLARIHEEHLQIGRAGRALDRAHHGREVGVGDVGHDHRNVARTPRDQPARPGSARSRDLARLLRHGAGFLVRPSPGR